MRFAAVCSCDIVHNEYVWHQWEPTQEANPIHHNVAQGVVFDEQRESYQSGPMAETIKGVKERGTLSLPSEVRPSGVVDSEVAARLEALWTEVKEDVASSSPPVQKPKEEEPEEDEQEEEVKEDVVPPGLTPTAAASSSEGPGKSRPPPPPIPADAELTRLAYIPEGG